MDFFKYFCRNSSWDSWVDCFRKSFVNFFGIISRSFQFSFKWLTFFHRQRFGPTIGPSSGFDTQLNRSHKCWTFGDDRGLINAIFYTESQIFQNVQNHPAETCKFLQNSLPKFSLRFLLFLFFQKISQKILYGVLQKFLQWFLQKSRKFRISSDCFSAGHNYGETFKSTRIDSGISQEISPMIILECIPWISLKIVSSCWFFRKFRGDSFR